MIDHIAPSIRERLIQDITVYAQNRGWLGFGSNFTT